MRPAFAFAVGLALALAAPAAAQRLDERGFRYVRTLETAGPGPARLEPDGPLFAHTKRDFADLRIVDARGRQVPWRILPPPAEAAPRPVRVLNRGRRDGKAVALLDLGPSPGVHDRIELDVPDTGFVARVVVRGSHDRKTFTTLSETVIYDVAGATRARSTTVVYPPADFRYLDVAASGVEGITGATLARFAPRPRFRPREIEDVEIAQRGRRTVVTADLGFENVPVDRLRIEAATARYDRPVEIEGSNDGKRWVDLAFARVFKLSAAPGPPIDLAARHRYLRATIDNGDDEPLAGIRVAALALPRTILVSGDHAPPLRLLYGNPRARAPRYDFARLPVATLGAEQARAAALGDERVNARYRPPPDTRSFAARHPEVVQAALAVAAIVLAVGGFLALRTRGAPAR